MKPLQKKPGKKGASDNIRSWKAPPKGIDPIARLRSAVKDYLYYSRMYNTRLPSKSGDLLYFYSTAFIEVVIAAWGNKNDPMKLILEKKHIRTLELSVDSLSHILKTDSTGALALFKEMKFDASPIFQFVHNMYHPNLDGSAVLAALDNFELHATNKMPDPPMQTPISENAMALLPLLSPIIYHKIVTITAKAKDAGLSGDRDTISAYLKELDDAGVAEKNPEGHGYRRIIPSA